MPNSPALVRLGLLTLVTFAAPLPLQPVLAGEIPACNANSLGQAVKVSKTIEKSASGTSSSGREFTNSWTFIAPGGYLISNVEVAKLKGGSNASYSEKWLPAGGSFSSRSDSSNAYQESLNLLAGYQTSSSYNRAFFDYQQAGSQASSWYNQVGSGAQAAYEFRMAVRSNSLGSGLFDSLQDVIGRYRVDLTLRCVGTAADQRTYFRNFANNLIRQYSLASTSQPPAQPGNGWSDPAPDTPPAQTGVDLAGTWQGNDGATYRIRQVGNQISWIGRGGNFENRFIGTIRGNRISGSWQDTERSQTQNAGTLVLEIRNGQLVKISGQGAFTGSRWTRL